MAPEPGRYRFGPFELDAGEGTLSRSGARLKLQDLPYRLLVFLVERAGETVSRDELRQRLWPENTFVEFDNSLAVALRKVRDCLADDAEAPRYVETIPRRGYRFIAPVTWQPTSLSAAQEGQSAEAASSIAWPASSPASEKKRAGTMRRLLPVLGLLAVVIGALAVRRTLVRSTTSAREDSPATVRVRRSVAVLGFRNLRGRPEDNWLSAAFSEMLNTELAAGGQLRLVSGEDVARAKSELPLADEDTLAKSTLQRLHTDPGADVVVAGSYTPVAGKDGSQIRLDLRLQDTATGETIAEESVTGSEEDLFDLVAQASSVLRQRLGMTSLTADSRVAVRASLPSNQTAVRLYTEGRARAWAFDFVGARDFLTKAIAADPDYPLAHSALSATYGHLGYGAKTIAEAKRALELSGNLSEEERLLIEGQYWSAANNSPKAVEACQKLFDRFPDNLDYGLRLATAQRYVNPTDSLATLARLRRLPPPAGEDLRIDLAEASSWINQDLDKAHAAARRVVEKGTAQGLNQVVAYAYGIICQQGVNSSSTTAEVIEACENARQRYAAEGDRNNEARAVSDLAADYFQHGDMARAEAMWRQARPEFREVGDLEGLAATANNLGDVFVLEGDLTQATRFLQESIPYYKTMEDKDGWALALNDLGDVARLEGDFATAMSRYREAKDLADAIRDKNPAAYVLTGMGDVLFDQANFAAARQSYEQSATLRKELGDKQALAQTQLALAQIDLEEGHASAAETTARECIQQFHQEQQTNDELQATGVLIRALLAQGKTGEAQKEAVGAAPLAARCQSRLYRLEFSLESARTLLATEQPERARTSLEQIVRDATQHQFVGLELDGRLALADLEKKSGRAAIARAQLAALEKSAHSRGFDRIARQARKLRDEQISLQMLPNKGPCVSSDPCALAQ